MYQLINSLAGKLSSLESDNDFITLNNDEFEIDGKLFFVSGTIYFTSSYNRGDYFTPSSGDRKFSSAELNVCYYDDEEDLDIYLNEYELEHLYKNID